MMSHQFICAQIQKGIMVHCRDLLIASFHSRSTIVIAASDGFWDAVEKLVLKSTSVASFIADQLHSYGNREDANRKLSEDLARWASSIMGDDVTVLVS